MEEFRRHKDTALKLSFVILQVCHASLEQEVSMEAVSAAHTIDFLLISSSCTKYMALKS
jgi:hypothetical protein